MQTELKDLVGKKVKRIFVNQEYLKFETDEGDFTYRVDGECCSSSYFYDFYGVKNLLENGKITEIKEVDIHQTSSFAEERYGDVIEIYGYQLTTEGDWGEVTSAFSFRNSSNGYYGGSIDKVDNIDVQPELLEDVTEIK